MESSGVIDGLRILFQSLHSSWLLGLSTVLFVLIQILRGKIGFEIPWLTKKFENLPKELKTWIILILFGLTGIITTILDVDKLSFWVVLDGFLCGITVGMTTIGLRSGIKQGVEGISTLREKVRQGRTQPPEQPGPLNSPEQ